MKRRWLLPLFFGCILAVTIGLILWPRKHEPEPQFNGLTVSAWLTRTTQRHSNVDFLHAIGSMGTNAYPSLLRAMRYKPPRWRVWLFAVASKSPTAARAIPGVNWLLEDRAEYRATAAMFGLAATKSSAECALPELRELANSKTPDISRRATLCIGWITNQTPILDFDLLPNKL